MVSCREATRLMSDALDRPVTLRERMGLRLHLAFCRGCRNFEKHMAFLRRACRSLVERDADKNERRRS